jgi:hypothetical protein
LGSLFGFDGFTFLNFVLLCGSCGCLGVFDFSLSWFACSLGVVCFDFFFHVIFAELLLLDWLWLVAGGKVLSTSVRNLQETSGARRLQRR